MTSVASMEARDFEVNTHIAEVTPLEESNMADDSPMAVDVDRDQELDVLKVCHHALRSVKEIEVRVGAELAKYWRTGDAKRESCERVLRMAVAEVEQQLAQLKQACEGNERNVAEELMAALNCATQVEVVEAVEELAVKAAMIDEIERCTNWEREQIVLNCKELKKRMIKLIEKEKEVASLQRELEMARKELQVLKSRKEESGKSGVWTTVPGKAAEETSKINIEALKRLKHEMSSCKPTLQAGRERPPRSSNSVSSKSRQSSGRTLMKHGELSSISSWEELSEVDSCGSEGMSRRSSQGSCSLAENQLGAYLRYVALPDVRIFSGKDKDYSWNNFIESFSLKYPTQNWSSEELKTLLKSKLIGQAKTRYEALPHRIRRGSFEGVVAALAETYKVDAQTSRVVALGKLKRLRKSEEQSVAEYCVLLEQLSVMAYPELDESALMTVRAHQLYEQLVHWPESYHLLVAMEMPGTDPYTSLKDTAMRIERRNLTLANTKDSVRTSGFSSRSLANAPARTPDVGGEKSRRSFKPAQAKPTVGDVEKGHQERQKETKTRCYKCQGMGHMARNCRVGSSHVESKAADVLQLQEDEEIEAKSQTKPLEASSFGNKYASKVEAGGRIWRALLDTGSEISIMPVAVYHLIKASGHISQEWPIDRKKKIVDASGNRMKFETMVRIPVRECDGEEAIIAMHVSQQKGQTLILGTNALPLLGYNLIRRSKGVTKSIPPCASKEEARGNQELASKVRGEQTSSADKEQASVVVAKRTYVAPGEMKNISVKGSVNPGERVFHSSLACLGSGVCQVDESGVSCVPVWNGTQEPLVLRAGCEVGKYEHDDVECTAVKATEVATDMLVLGKPALHESERKRLLEKFLKENRNMYEQDEPELWRIVAEYDKVFAVEDRELTQTDLVIHEVDTGNTPPIRQKELLDRGIIEASESEWASPVVLVKKKDGSLRLENDYDVDSSMHFLHVRFKCDGQSFPSIDGRPGFSLSACRCSQKTTVSDLIPSVPPPAAGERVQCVLDAARALAIWWGEGSISCKVQRIVNSSYLALNPKSVAVAYCFFKSRCSHVALMSGMVPQDARFNHTILPGWPWDTSRIIQYGWHMARSLEWSTISSVVSNANEHARTVILVPDVLRRLTFCRKGPRTTLFYYRSFREVRRNNNVLFADEVGTVVWVMPPREPEDAYSWIQFTAAVDLWLSCGAHVWMVNGPRSCDDGSWNRMNQRARTHILGYLDDHADFAQQWHDLLPEDVGVLKASMACLRVGVVEDPRKWWEVPRALEFFDHLTRQLKEHGVQLEALKVPKSMKVSGGPAHTVNKVGGGGPPIKDGRISKRHLKRVEKRQERSRQKLIARGLQHLNIRSEDRSTEEGGM
ncbi:zinc knuckle [Ostertagia ostertagi]